MIDDHLAEQAALYASGALTADERELFELLLEFHGELAAHVAGLLEVAATATLAAHPAPLPAPSPDLKARVLRALENRPQRRASGLVVTGPDRRVQWVNDAFTEMCGYRLEELAGKSLGPILQGRDTDPAAAERMRRAVHASRPCHETILNYHKNGSPYWVEIDLKPIFDGDGAVRWMIAREHEREDLALPAA